MYNLINRVRKPSEENQAPDLTQLGRTCEAAGLLDEARGWYLLAIGRDPLDAESQQALAAAGRSRNATRASIVEVDSSAVALEGRE